MPEHPSRNRFCRTVASTFEAVESTCQDLRVFLDARRVAASRFATELVVREFLNNAVLHGNRLDASKTADLEVCLGRIWITVRVTDQGTGFDWRRVMRRPLEGAAATHGRGLTIGKTYGRRLTYSLGGRQVRVRLEKAPANGDDDVTRLHD